MQVFLSGPCALCHSIRGTDASGQVAPDLTHLASRSKIAAGTLPNTPGHLAGWIVDSQHIKPGNAMPPTSLSGEDLQALLSYLRSLA
jgi:cytochrome c oxidase subunit 2